MTVSTELLVDGELSVVGQLVDASNASLFCALETANGDLPVIYKPMAGERPLWDFPDHTLSHREVAAYVVSEALGWSVVPPTVWRAGPFGPGMVQQWIEVDDTVDVVALIQSDRADLRRMALFDALVNNADRKGGHILPTAVGDLWGIDHGVTFAVEDKLRTVLWQWRGARIPDALLGDLDRWLGESASPSAGAAVLRSHLNDDEIHALRKRAEQLLTSKTHPEPSPDWPAIPWPPF